MTKLTYMGRRLRSARIKAGYETAKEAAKRFGWVLSTYRSHENGQTPLRVPSANRYASAFNVTPDWLLFGNNRDATSIDRLLEGKPAHTKRIAKRLIEAMLSEDR